MVVFLLLCVILPIIRGNGINYDVDAIFANKLFQKYYFCVNKLFVSSVNDCFDMVCLESGVRSIMVYV